MIVREHISFKKGAEPKDIMRTNNDSEIVWNKLAPGMILKVINDIPSIGVHAGAVIKLTNVTNNYQAIEDLKLIEFTGDLYFSEWKIGKKFFVENFIRI